MNVLFITNLFIRHTKFLEMSLIQLYQRVIAQHQLFITNPAQFPITYTAQLAITASPLQVYSSEVVAPARVFIHSRKCIGLKNFCSCPKCKAIQSREVVDTSSLDQSKTSISEVAISIYFSYNFIYL
jgi:hypothetical protein